MDKISEILNSVKERVSNPLIFSFLISWLIYNWKIPVALIWFDEKQITANGCSSIFEFIEDELKRNGYFSTPLFIAFGYTFLFPIIKNLISATQTWMTKWGENWNLNLSKNSKISMDKYLSLRNEYKSKIEVLEKIISEENKLRIENNNLLELNKNLKSEKEEIFKKASSVRHKDFLNGKWKINFPNGDKPITVKVFRFLNGDCYIDAKDDAVHYIADFYNDWKNKEIFFIIKSIDFNRNKEFYYLSLRYDGENKLIGYFNDNQIELLKIEI